MGCNEEVTPKKTKSEKLLELLTEAHSILEQMMSDGKHSDTCGNTVCACNCWRSDVEKLLERIAKRINP